jgi:hypothetical protein
MRNADLDAADCVTGEPQSHRASFANHCQSANYPAQAATTDPEILIYRFAGVADDGGTSNAGVATVISCTNFSGVTEMVRIVVRTDSGTLKINSALPVSHLSTTISTTHTNRLYPAFGLLTGQVYGTAAIAATSTNIICTAVVVDAASTVPNGFALRGIRFSPAPGSQE